MSQTLADLRKLVELRGFEPLTSCMPCFLTVQTHFW
jgi:hypothetical protein